MAFAAECLFAGENLRLAELLATQAATAPGGSVKHDHAALRDRVRAAYHDVAGGFNRRVLLRDLRPKLSDVDREKVDATLMQMLRDEEASLMQLDYRPDVQPRPGADLSRHPFTGFELHHLKLLDRGEISCASIDLDTG
jgi:hypothetical protein